MEARVNKTMFETYSEFLNRMFKKIYECAKARDRATLTELVKKGYSFEISVNQLTPAGLLALEGDHLSVDFLINEFKVDLDTVVYAYASLGYEEKVKSLLAERANVNYAMMGAAKSNNGSLIAYCRTKGAKDAHFFIGLARGKHVDQIKHNLQMSSPVINFCNNFIVVGAIPLNPYIVSVAYALALENNTELFEMALSVAQTLDKDNPMPGFNRYTECLNRGASAYAQAGALDKAHDLRLRGASFSEVASGAALAADVENVEACFKEGATVESIVYGFFNRWTFHSVETTVQLLSFIQDVDLRQAIAIEVGKRNLLVNSNPALCLARALTLNSIMNKDGCTYEEATEKVELARRSTSTMFGSATYVSTPPEASVGAPTMGKI